MKLPRAKLDARKADPVRLTVWAMDVTMVEGVTLRGYPLPERQPSSQASLGSDARITADQVGGTVRIDGRGSGV